MPQQKLCLLLSRRVICKTIIISGDVKGGLQGRLFNLMANAILKAMENFV